MNRKKEPPATGMEPTARPYPVTARGRHQRGGDGDATIVSPLRWMTA